MALAGAALANPTPSQALITPPVTIAGPSSDIVEFGGVAMAPDGTGGLVFTKVVQGVPHIFASRYVDNRWSAPIRVDGDQPFEASQPRIAAGQGGEILVAWVTQVATVHGKVRYGLFSAGIGPGASAFGPSQMVDANVGEGNSAGVDPSLSATAQGQAIVAYRVVTYTFDGSKPIGNVQLRPGDVLAEIRVGKLKGERWSGLGAINVNLESSTRAPSPTNGPEVGAGVDGDAVVAWQEPDQSGTARVWMRRIFGTVLGPILEASPSSWGGSPVTGDAEAFSLAVTPLDQARIAMRIAGNGPQAPARLFLNTLPPDYETSSALLGPKLVFAPESPSTPLGPPGISAYEKGGVEGLLRLGFVAGNQIRQTTVDPSGNLTPIATVAGPPAAVGAEAATAIDPEGDGVIAYPALDSSGRPTLAVRQEFAAGTTQLGLISGAQAGPIGPVRIGSSDSGDALIGFRQGEPGQFEIVGERVSAPPVSFPVEATRGWTKPADVRLKWQQASSTVGGVTYTVLLGGRTIMQGLHRRAFHPRPALLGTGRMEARVLATDAFGQQVVSKPVKLLVDGEPPIVRIKGPNRGGAVTVQVRDSDSGVDVKATKVRFGDGSSLHGGSRFRHVYGRAGRYEVVVRARDRVGNRTTRRFEVRVQ